MSKPESDRPKIKVGCRAPNGVTLQLWRQGRQEDMGAFVKDGPPVFLPGPITNHVGTGNTDPELDRVYTEVDQDFWNAWVEQNKGKNALLDLGFVQPLDENEAKAENTEA